MNQETLETLLDKWMNDVSFLEQVRQNPEAAISQAGVALNDEDRQSLRTIDWSLSDEELQSRISKAS